MNLAKWCIENNRTSLVLFLIIAISGVMTFFSIPKAEDPEFTIRTGVISTVFPGASPQRVEELVTDKLEEKVREIDGVKTVESQSMSGLSILKVEFEDSIKDMQPYWQKLRNKVDDAAGDLPEEAYTPAVNDEFGDVYGIVIALTGDGFSYRELKDVADDMRDQLLKIKGVGKVERWGVQDERIFVDFTNSRMAAAGVSPFALAQMIDSQNTLQPSGSSLVGPERIVIEPTGEFKGVEDIYSLAIRPPGQKTSVRLADVADISRGFSDPPSTLTRFNGAPCLMLAVSMADGGNITDLGERVTKKLDEMRANLYVGLEANVVVFQPDYVKTAINDFMINLIESFAFVVVVILAFAGLRTGIIAGSLVPMAMLGCIALMPLFGVGLQRISIASLIISLGILVDNGVVVSEAILVRLASGENRLKAAVGAVSELWMPLLAASLTTIFAFLPIPLATTHPVGEFCSSLFVVVTLTLACSWALSMSMVPMLCYYLLKPKVTVQTYANRLYRAYRGLLLWSLRNRTVFVALILIFCAVSGWAFRYVPKMFFPPNERAQFTIDFWQPYGTDITATERRVERLEKVLLADADVSQVGVFVGHGGPRWYLPLNLEQKNDNLATFVVNTRSVESVDGVIKRTRKALEDGFPDADYSLNKLMNGPPVGAKLQIRLSGPDIKTLYALRDEIVPLVESQPGVTRVWDDWGQWTKKMMVEVDQDKAREAGLSSFDVAVSLQAAMSGLRASNYREGDTIIPILLRNDEGFRGRLDKLDSLNVYSYDTGASVPLSQVATTRLDWQPSDIRRRDQGRTMTIKADVADGYYALSILNTVRPEVTALMAKGDWPLGYSVEYGGEFEESAEAQAAINANMPLAMGLLVLVLVFQFNSIRRPVIILLTLPPMIIGIAAGMLATNSPFGFMPMLGMISLLGIIVNNAIMLIDRIEIQRKRGLDLDDSIVLSAMERARPIIMTATTTIIGMVPLSLQGGEMWRPMANLIMSGLTVATVLTLVLCPVLYSLFFRQSFKGYVWDQAVVERGSDIPTAG
ncbi:efflux RND transporter permease subunit [Pseudodesulfovibrio indicus]|uniref:Acriflavin resistance protein n=1 Tax=Pseudodesulfovibrio indicus TaxID=1716143 RepID=A0A126QS20_9BACT|nr:efflux RND transporter permease subunit [Pseudodesulfovibrio indicus]AMK12578.1 acriflavin resistance protein [Pseudodesulfovibrio indicus]TDT90888.1 multidrug efflux pump subunit AcrB [Pseudodesulfovibrio indicus]